MSKDNFMPRQFECCAIADASVTHIVPAVLNDVYGVLKINETSKFSKISPKSTQFLLDLTEQVAKLC